MTDFTVMLQFFFWVCILGFWDSGFEWDIPPKTRLFCTLARPLGGGGAAGGKHATTKTLVGFLFHVPLTRCTPNRYSLQTR